MTTPRRPIPPRPVASATCPRKDSSTGRPTRTDREERLTSIEGGGKLRLFDGRATLNGSAFHYNYKDYQAFAIVNLVQKIFNVDATANGGEVEFRFAPNSKWELGLSGAFIHSDVRNVPLPDGTLAGRVLPNAPSVSLYGLARYNFEVFGGQLGAQVNTNYIGRHYLTTLNEPTNFEGSHVTTDLRLDFAPPNSHFTYAAFVRNVTNVWARIYGLDVSSLGYSASVYAPPRTYGMTVAWRY